MATWDDFDIDVANARGAGVEVKTTCPKCSHTRKKSTYPCLNINLEKEVWLCWHCDWSGSLKQGEERVSNPHATPLVYRQPPYRATTLPGRVIKWFSERGIPEEVLARNRISYGSVYMPQIGRETTAIQFPYLRNGEVVNVKYRDGRKYFRMASGAERILYGLDDIEGDSVTFVEGECFPGEAEILTPEGWCRFDCYNGGKVAQYESDGSIAMVSPLALVRKEFVGKLIRHINDQRFFSCTTPEHQMVAQSPAGKLRKHDAKEPISRTDTIPRVGILDGPGVSLSDDQIALCLAVSEDASVRTMGYRSPYAVFGFKKKRKAKRLRALLQRLALPHSDTQIVGGYTSICFHLPSWCTHRLLPHAWLTQLSLRQRQAILAEMVYWDGNRVPHRAQTEYSSKEISNAVWMQTLAHTCGMVSTIMQRQNAFGTWYKVSVLHRKTSTSWQSIRSKSLPYEGMVHCVQVPSGMLLVRQQGCISVSGNCDKLALEVAGITSCVSVPDGAPAPNSKQYESKFDFLLSAESLLQPLKRIILAVDDDPPGRRLAEELARRLGPERCYTVTWPAHCKDANDVLMVYDSNLLRDCIEHARPWPIRGIVEIADLDPALTKLYHDGIQRGSSTGWPSLEPYYTVRPGELTILTGIPGHGKSLWVSALLVNLMQMHGWRATIYSPEHYPLERYAALLLEQRTGRTFSAAQGQMTWEMLTQARDWLAEHVTFLMPEDEEPTVDHLLLLARAQVYRRGIKGLVLDPWNEIEHKRPPSMNETEYVSQTLSRLRRFARSHGVHVWLVAHPTKMVKAQKGRYEGSYPPPTPYDVSGCHAADTDVLTMRGWVSHAEVTLEDRVACFDPHTETLRYEYPLKVWAYQYDGAMYHVSGRSFDALVTPQHRMVLKPQWRFKHTPIDSGRERPFRYSRAEWSFVAIENVVGDMDMPWAAPCEGGVYQEQILGYPANGFLMFLGWWLSEGWVNKVSGGLGLSQGIGPLCDKMRFVMTETGIEYTEAIGSPGSRGTIPSWKAYIGVRNNRHLCQWLPEHCGMGSANVHIPALIWNLPASQKVVLLRALIEGDGTNKGGDNYAYSTVSTQLADDVQRLAIECGRMSSITSLGQEKPWHTPPFQVNIGRIARRQIGIRMSKHVRKVDYAGMVYCLTVPTGAYLVRRNGKPGIYGNSANFRNKADNCITVWRDMDSADGRVEIHVQKIRYREIGRPGQIEMVCHPWCGRYVDLGRGSNAVSA